jgi:hypothetical protein
MFSSVDPLLAAWKMRKNYLGGVHFDFTKSQASSCMYFQGQSRRFIGSKEQAKTLSLIFSSTRKQKIVKNICAYTERTYLIL